jgi:argininosuccinate lyase
MEVRVRMRGGRFADRPDERAAKLGRSIDVDSALALEDLAGSIAHVHGLAGAGILGPDEADRLVAGLEALRDAVTAGTLEWNPDLEDVHLNLEAALTDRIGPLGGKLHTGRSRNDQIATDLRLWLRRAVDDLDRGLVGLERAILDLADGAGSAVMPGITHLQPAQPVLVAHHLLAYVEMLERDRDRLADVRRRANLSPLGSGAVAGAGFPIDRAAVAAELQFDGVTRNSIDAVSDRDFAADLLAAAAIAGMHLSRLAEELTWWSHPAFGWARLAEAFSTGSSMMPNKRNPDPAELIRGKAARLTGALMTVLGLLHGLPLAYQRDLQESVEPLLDGAATLEASVAVMTGLLSSLTLDLDRMAEATTAGFLTATSVADALVDRGVPFRAAHEIVGRVVRAAESRGFDLPAAPDSVWQELLRGSPDPVAVRLAGEPGIEAALREAATIQAAVARPDVVGGTAPARVRGALAAARQRLSEAEPG